MKIELAFEGMTCLECSQKLEQALESIPGVTSAQVSYPTKRGTVTASEKVETADLLTAVERSGYRATVIGDGTLSAPGDHGARRFRNSEALGADKRGDAPADYDLVIIGTGGAGAAAAIRGSELGATVAIIEGADVVGGTCVNVGCIPSKNLIEAAHHYHTSRSHFPGIMPCAAELVWTELLRQKRTLIEELRQEKYLDVLAAYESVTLIRGTARLLGNGEVDVSGRKIRARKLIIATGTKPALPPIPGLQESRPLDSTTVMELETLPTSMIVIGAGAIGLELGQAFSRFGVKVVVIEALDRIVPTEDPEISSALTESLRTEGIEIHAGVKVTNVARDSSGFTVGIQNGSLTGELKAEQLLVAVGRRPMTAELGLEKAGVQTDARGFIPVNDFMGTSNPDIFAAGDVTGGPGFVYVAALGGRVAAQAALAYISGEEPIPIDLTATPRITFTDPQVAAVGLTEAEARDLGFTPKVTSMPAKYLPRAVVSYRRAGVFKLVADAKTDRLLGAHVVVANAGDIISEAVIAVKFGLRVQDLVSTLHPYLTWGEGIKLAAQTFTTDVATLSCCA